MPLHQRDRRPARLEHHLHRLVVERIGLGVTRLATGQLRSADGFRRVIVSYRNGAAVRLGDLAAVEDSVENDKAAAWYTNKAPAADAAANTNSETGVESRCVVLFIQRQPGTNTIKVVDGVKELLPSFRSQLPASVSLDIFSDRSIAIRESVHDVKFTLVLAIALVVMVIFVFLRTLAATLIASVAIPIAVCIAVCIAVPSVVATLHPLSPWPPPSLCCNSRFGAALSAPALPGLPPCAPTMKSYDSLKLCALSAYSPNENYGTSQALCTPMMKSYDNLKLCALSVHSTHGNCIREGRGERER
jgi:hypothetical protein